MDFRRGIIGGRSALIISILLWSMFTMSAYTGAVSGAAEIQDQDRVITASIEQTKHNITQDLQGPSAVLAPLYTNVLDTVKNAAVGGLYWGNSHPGLATVNVYISPFAIVAGLLWYLYTGLTK